MKVTIRQVRFRDIRVLYNEQLDPMGRHEAWNRGYAPGDKMVEVLAFPLSIPSEITDAVLVDQLYDALNFHPADWLARVSKQLAAVKGRSMSVGDVLVIGDTARAVERFGWSEVATPSNVESVAAPESQ